MGTLEERTEAVGILASAIYKAIASVQRAGYILDPSLVRAAISLVIHEWTDYAFPSRDGEPKDPSQDDILGSTN